MPAPVGITREEHSAADLRCAAARCRDGAASRRMLALALVKDGGSRAEAARSCGMDRQTLRDWVHRYNAGGLAALSDRWGGGCKPRLNQVQRARLVELVRSGPDLAVHGVVRWRRIDLARVIAAEFDVTLAERTIGKLLRALGFSRISARPHHPEHDGAAQDAHKKTLPAWSPQPFPTVHAASLSSFGGKTRPASASKAR